MRLSACFLSCLLSNPQTAAALQRNTRPSTHDAARPVYGQETVRPIPLPQYRAGKVSFFLFIFVKTTTRQYDNVQRLSGLELLIFPVQKKANPTSFFCLPGHCYCRILAFFWTQTREEGFISWSKENFFLAGQAREITSGQDVAIFPARVVNPKRVFALSCPLANSVIL